MKENKPPMFECEKLARRKFIKTTVVGTMALPFFGSLAFNNAFGQGADAKSPVFRVDILY
jgi:hypothetical protein